MSAKRVGREESCGFLPTYFLSLLEKTIPTVSVKEGKDNKVQNVK